MSRKISDYFPKLSSKFDSPIINQTNKDENGNSLDKSSTINKFSDHKLAECRVILKDLFKNDEKLWKINLESQKSPEHAKNTEIKKISINLMDIGAEYPKIKNEILENTEIESNLCLESAVRPETAEYSQESTDKVTSSNLGHKNGISEGTTAIESPKTPKRCPRPTLKIKLPKIIRNSHNGSSKTRPNLDDAKISPSSSSKNRPNPVDAKITSSTDQNHHGNIKHKQEQHLQFKVPKIIRNSHNSSSQKQPETDRNESSSKTRPNPINAKITSSTDQNHHGNIKHEQEQHLKFKVPKNIRNSCKSTSKNRPTPEDAKISPSSSSKNRPNLGDAKITSSTDHNHHGNIKHEQEQHLTIILPQPETKQLPKYTKFKDVSDKFTKLGHKQFRCSICQKVIKTEFNLGTHLASHSKVRPKCDKCHRSFSNHYTFKIHVCEATSKFCSICNISFSFTCSYRVHMKTFHSDLVTQNILECDICGKKFYKKFGIRFHMQTSHVGKYGQYICDYDGKKFSSRNYIYAHMQNHFPKYMKCGLCSKEMKVSCYTQHLATMHSDKNFKCQICPKSFKNLAYWNLHQKYHVKKFTCGSCGKKFANNFELARHVRDFHENPRSLSCKICGKRFNTNYGLNCHMKLHKKDRPMPFECQKCPFKTDRSGYLRLHKKFHQKFEEKYSKMENPLKCDKCWKFFRDERTLNEHMKNAHPEKLFQCDFCGKEVKLIGRIYSHIKTCHNPYI